MSIFRWDNPKPLNPTTCKEIALEPYPVYLHIGVANKFGKKEQDMDGFVNVMNRNNLYLLINYEAIKTPAVLYEVISHEAYHVVDEIEITIGDSLKGEAGAYLLGHIVKLAAEEVRKYEIRKKIPLNKRFVR